MIGTTLKGRELAFWGGVETRNRLIHSRVLEDRDLTRPALLLRHKGTHDGGDRVGGNRKGSHPI